MVGMTTFGVSCLISLYWIWRAHDRITEAKVEINWVKDIVYWLLAYAGIILFYLALTAYPLAVIGFQTAIGLMLLLSVRPINGKWFLGLLNAALCGIILIISEVLLARYGLDYTSTSSDKDHE
jgi:hypothetical protein